MQRILYENANFLSKKQLEDHVILLNNQNNQESPLAAEWEIVCLNAFNKVEAIIHEPEMGKRPDVLIPDTGSGEPFIVEIRSISDKGYEKENPFKVFQKKINEQISEYKLNGNCFSFHIGGQDKGSRGDLKRLLKIPVEYSKRVGVYAEIITYLKTIKENPDICSTFDKNNNSIKIHIEYNPNSKGQSWTFPAYKIPYSLKRNPLYNALHDKVKQVKNATFIGRRGIVICDGDCETLRRNKHSFDEYCLDDIIQKFFKDHSSISIVTIVTVDEGKPLSIRARHFCNPNAALPIDNSVISLLEKVFNNFPTPVDPPYRATIQAKYKEGLSFHGGGSGSAHKVKISSRSLVKLLNGQLTWENFLSDYDIIGKVFQMHLAQGCLFENITMEKCLEQDDDWITFTFKDSDPAISEFKIP